MVGDERADNKEIEQEAGKMSLSHNMVASPTNLSILIHLGTGSSGYHWLVTCLNLFDKAVLSCARI